MHQRFLLVASLSIACAATAASAQAPSFTGKQTTSTAGDRTTVTSSYETPVGKGGVTAGPQATTTYTMPGSGPNGPIPGNKAGSSTSTSAGVAVTIPLPEGKK